MNDAIVEIICKSIDIMMETEKRSHKQNFETLGWIKETAENYMDELVKKHPELLK